MNMHPLEPITLKIFFLFYFFSMILYVAYPIAKEKIFYKLGRWCLIIGFLFNTANLIFRGIAAGRVPFANEYESLLIFVWGIGLCFLGLQLLVKIDLLGLIVAPIMVGVTALANQSAKEITPLMPALKSNWIIYHVAVAIIAYGAFAVSFGLAALYLIRESIEKNKGKKAEPESSLLSLMPDLKTLDSLIYKIIAFAFPFLALLIITGAVWAEIAWGTYWSWDPKETWSLITALIYAGYLHARYFFKWRGRAAALFALFGFIAVIFCYWGVNHWLSGLHSYGGGK